jgi:hypothetical protein
VSSVPLWWQAHRKATSLMEPLLCASKAESWLPGGPSPPARLALSSCLSGSTTAGGTSSNGPADPTEGAGVVGLIALAGEIQSRDSKCALL